MNPTYDVDYFIKKFEAISEDMWCTHAQTNSHGQHCAWGHCGITNEQIGFRELDNHALKVIQLTRKSGFEWHLGNKAFANINNGAFLEYQQPTPKQRILAALYDIKKMQLKDIDAEAKEPQVKERIVYVSVAESIRKQSLDLLTSN